MTKIKICGLRRMEDVVWSNELLPDYVGFVFAKSKRQVTAAQAKAMIDALNPSIQTVGVFVNADADTLKSVQETCGLDILQLHGEESVPFCEALKPRVWKAFRVKSQDDFAEANRYKAESYLLDGFDLAAHGGTGTAFDWRMAKEYQFNAPLVIAGGIDETNVNQVIDILSPMAVDVSSAVETDGYKDAEKVA
ncbi:MAG: phosphoribosylanthranilate isomerase, partial [Eubacteriales bacterium]